MPKTVISISEITYYKKEDIRILSACLSNWFTDPKILHFTSPNMTFPFNINWNASGLGVGCTRTILYVPTSLGSFVLSSLMVILYYSNRIYYKRFGKAGTLFFYLFDFSLKTLAVSGAKRTKMRDWVCGTFYK